MMGIGMTELLIVLVIVLVIFGAKKLPEIGGGMGKAIKNFKKATTEPEEIDVTSESSQSSQKKEDKEQGEEQEEKSEDKKEDK